MPFAGLDTHAIARALAQIADTEDDLADAFFERVEEVEVAGDDSPPIARARREEGLAVRLVRAGRSWASSRDAITPALFSAAVRQVARVQPRAAYSDPTLSMAPPESLRADEMMAVPKALEARIRELDAAFPLRLRLRRHRRDTLVVGTRLVSDAQREHYYSCEATFGWGRYGALLVDLGDEAIERVAQGLVALFRARRARPLPSIARQVVLGPEAAAVLLHEAVAHSLEVDTLALTGHPEAAIGVALGSPLVSVLDDPASAPEPVRRSVDDEGIPVVRRWLLREGVVEQPIADGLWGAASRRLLPGGGRRATRHDAPGPRSTHLELLPGDHETADLWADGLLLERVERGRLDPATGRLEIVFPWGRSLSGGRRGGFVGRCRLRSTVGDVLSSVVGVGRHVASAGAGWCAKGGQRLAVWATAPALRCEGIEVRPA